jgi:2-C-methyl-D-erythritol 4-phosphate cytidylyltransferase
MKVIVIIPAAGLGTRMTTAGGAKSGTAVKAVPSKQFAQLAGVPILIHTLRKFAAVPQVAEIYVALRTAEAESFKLRLADEGFAKPIHLVEGGEHRQESVANALLAVSASDDDVVLVHDAVRPFVETEIIDHVIEAVLKHGAAIAGVPAVDTIKLVERSADAALITSTVPRERAVLAQTPQGFRLGLLREAMRDAMADGLLGTDEASLVERTGHVVAVVMGSPRNLKITTPADLELAEFYMTKATLPSTRRD